VAQPAGSRTANPQLLPEYAEGTVYIVHLDPPYRHARHYSRTSADPGCLQQRLADHHTSNGPWLLRVQKAAGGSWHLVATFPGSRDTERQLKNGQCVPSYCPECTPSPRTEMPAVDPVKAAARNARRAASRAAWKQQQAAVATPEETAAYWAPADEAVARLRASTTGESR
jgi:hypothetical protein